MIGAHSAGRGPAFDRVVDAAEMRALEAQAPPGVNLMQNAGQAIAAAILRRTGSVGGRSVVVLVGPGDNGGDALIAAARLAATGARVTAWASRERPHDPLVAAATARGVRWRVWTGNPRPLTHDVRWATCLLDGLLGIGSTPPLRGPIADILAELADSRNWTDPYCDRHPQRNRRGYRRRRPSRLSRPPHAGHRSREARRPAAPGHRVRRAADCAGHRPSGRGLRANQNRPHRRANRAPPAAPASVGRPQRHIRPSRHRGRLGPLPRSGRPGHRGRVACRHRPRHPRLRRTGLRRHRRTGARRHLHSFARPHPTGQLAATAADVAASFARPTALLVGPGLGRSNAGDALVYGLLDKLPDTPKVIDADGLNALADRPDLLETLGPENRSYPASRRTGASSPAGRRRPEGRQRLSAAKNLAAQTRAIVVAKGSPTFICATDRVWILARPNPALAAAGSGDVLAGAIASLLAQGLAAIDAARLGVWIHSRAARIAGGRDDRGVSMEQVAAALGAAVNLRRARPRRGPRRRRRRWHQSGAP